MSNLLVVGRGYNRLLFEEIYQKFLRNNPSRLLTYGFFSSEVDAVFELNSTTKYEALVLTNHSIFQCSHRRDSSSCKSALDVVKTAKMHGLPVLLFSSANRSLEERFVEVGTDKIIQKPIDLVKTPIDLKAFLDSITKA